MEDDDVGTNAGWVDVVVIDDDDNGDSTFIFLVGVDCICTD